MLIFVERGKPDKRSRGMRKNNLSNKPYIYNQWIPKKLYIYNPCPKQDSNFGPKVIDARLTITPPMSPHENYERLLNIWQQTARTKYHNNRYQCAHHVL